MNFINQLEVEYINPSRTIEKLEIESGKRMHECFIYNYEGNHFRFFENEVTLKIFSQFWG